ncbi:hypothetical protein NDU88_005394 [Pleurodeles waltl]|uniref:Uncharacterized protein n=1 Tax=Pleurodeles waltl TaxID=8319 RepID=A0AAV7L0N1_PLEWA|nr:hypothetical protein NDU88_005394 [Pleurodeles waltl]
MKGEWPSAAGPAEALSWAALSLPFLLQHIRCFVQQAECYMQPRGPTWQTRCLASSRTPRDGRAASLRRAERRIRASGPHVTDALLRSREQSVFFFVGHRGEVGRSEGRPDRDVPRGTHNVRLWGGTSSDVLRDVYVG